MTRGTQETCTFSRASVRTVDIPATPLSVRGQSSNHPALTLHSSGSATFLLAYWLLRTSSLLRPGPSPAPSLPAGRGGILSGTSVAAHRPVHSDICVCASVGCLPSFPGAEPSVAPWEAAARAFWRCHPREPRWIPCCPGGTPPSPTSALSPINRCLSWKRCLPRCSLDSLSSFLQLFAQSLYLWILPNHPVQICSPLPHTSVSLFYLIVLVSANHHRTCYILSLLVLCRSPH